MLEKDIDFSDEFIDQIEKKLRFFIKKKVYFNFLVEKTGQPKH